MAFSTLLTLNYLKLNHSSEGYLKLIQHHAVFCV